MFTVPIIDISAYVNPEGTSDERAEVARQLYEAATNVGFMQIVGQYYGQRPLIYTTVDFYKDNQLGTMRAEFWLRSVADHPRGTYPGQPWTFWQYTGTGTAPGFRS